MGLAAARRTYDHRLPEVVRQGAGGPIPARLGIPRSKVASSRRRTMPELVNPGEAG